MTPYRKIKKYLSLSPLILFMSCSHTPEFGKKVPSVERDRFMGTWNVWAGRTTFIEKKAFASQEIYTWNEEKKQIDIDFRFRRGGLQGRLLKLPQTGTIVPQSGNAHWKVSPFWPLSFDYLVIALADDYSWTVIGVPNQQYIWIMGRTKTPSPQVLTNILQHVKDIGYRSDDIVPVINE
jgi:apolipoprotein D and lipocalin family protein